MHAVAPPDMCMQSACWSGVTTLVNTRNVMSAISGPDAKSFLETSFTYFVCSQMSFSDFQCFHTTLPLPALSPHKDPSSLSSLRCFVGPAALLAARHRFRRAEALPEEDPEVLEATYQVAQALAAEGPKLSVSSCQRQ